MFLAQDNWQIHGVHVAIIPIIFKVHMDFLFIINVSQDSLPYLMIVKVFSIILTTES